MVEPQHRSARTAAARRAPRGILPLLFAVSGASALVLEVVWTRWLVLGLGAGTHATTLVLAVYMGGLGTGAYAAGRLADRRPDRALGIFAGAEALIAAWGLLSIALVAEAIPALSGFLARAWGAPSLPMALRALIAALALAPPTFLMGATLPLLSRWAADRGFLPARGAGVLYTTNTLGGMVGALAAPFVLMDAFGLRGAVAAASLADLAVACAAWLLLRRATACPPPATARGEGAAAPAAPRSRAPSPAASRSFPAALAAYFVSGFVGLALEVVSHRILSLLAGSSVYAFSVMLAAVLAGIAGGSAAASRWADRAAHPAAWLGATLGGLALGIGASARLFASGGWTAAARAAGAVPGLRSFPYGFELLGCLVTLLPATLMLGAAVPLIARVASEVPERFAGRFGLAYGFNTGGAVAGAAIAALVLIPWIGCAGSMILLALLAGATGFAVVLAAVPRSRRLPALAACGAPLAAAVLLAWGADPVRSSLRSQFRGREPLVVREGPVQTVAVVRDDNELHLESLRMVANKTSLTGTHLYSRRYMGLLGHLPALWAESPRSGLVICFGTGITAAAAASHRGVERLDIAEISPEVIAVEPYFREVNGHVLADPRVRMHVEDGRHLLLSAREPWGFVSLEPPPPRDSGVVSLYTTDFYRLCLARLEPGGVVAQWCPLLSETREEIRMVVRAFVDAFPYALGFLPVERELLLLGGNRPLVADLREMGDRMSAPAATASLAQTGFFEPADVLATAVADRDALLRFASGAETLTDDRPRVELFARFGRDTGRPDVRELASSPVPIERLASGPLSDSLRERFRIAREALGASLGSGWAREARRGEEWERLALEAVRLRKHDPYYLWAAGLSDGHLARLRERVAAGWEGAHGWVLLAGRESLRGRTAEAVEALRQALRIAPDEPEALVTLGMILLDVPGKTAEARMLLERFLDLAPGDPAAEKVRRTLAARGP